MVIARKVLYYLRPYRLAFLGALGQLLLINLLELLKPWPLKVVIDHVLAGHPLPVGPAAGWSPTALLLAACVALVLVHVVLGAMTLLNLRTSIRIGQRMAQDLRGDLYAHLHRLSLAFHTRRRVGDLLYRVTADTYALQTLATRALFPLVSAVLLLGGMFVVLVRMDWFLTLLALSVGPVLLVALAGLNPRIATAATAARERESGVYALVQQALSAIRVVQAFTREPDEHRRFMAASRDSLAASLRLYTLQTLYSWVASVVIALGTATVVWVGARAVLDGTLTLGQLVVFISYLASLYVPVSSLVQTYGLVHGAKAGVQRVMEVLSVERDLEDGPRVLGPGHVVGEIAWEGVWFEYAPGQPVLRDVTLQVGAGERVAIVGPTGVGKSTLVSLVPRFYDPQAGRVRLDGVDLREFQLASLRRQVAMVLQPPLVFPLTIRENIAYGRPHARLEDVIAAARLAAVHDFATALPGGYDTVVGEGGATLSEGEKLRITIARAILRAAPILILDEATASLDATTEGLIMSGLGGLTAGRTCLIIAHRLSTIRDADRIVVLGGGGVVEQGSFADLMRRGGAFAALYHAQFAHRDGELQAVPVVGSGP